MQFETGVPLQREDIELLIWRYKERTYECLAEEQFRKMKQEMQLSKGWDVTIGLRKSDEASAARTSDSGEDKE